MVILRIKTITGNEASKSNAKKNLANNQTKLFQKHSQPNYENVIPITHMIIIEIDHIVLH